MGKLNLTRHYKSYYTAASYPEIKEIEAARYLSVAGRGDPSEKAYANDLGALYSIAYGVKFICKAEDNDFVVGKLEGLWNYDEEKYAGVSMAEAPLKIPRSEWNYRMLIRIPDFVAQKHVNTAIHNAVTRKGLLLAEKVTVFDLPAQKVVQMLHLGPFDQEHKTLLQIKGFIDSAQLQRDGLHHEIYLNDFNRTAGENLKTILREPVK